MKHFDCSIRVFEHSIRVYRRFSVPLQGKFRQDTILREELSSVPYE